jgi:pimeloyl-ACP methyl ester carboxylesterase
MGDVSTTSTAPERHTFDWRDGAVHWTREGDGPAVVLCHGTPWSSTLWDGVARALATDHTVYRWDMIGYGSSEKRDGQDVSLAAQGELFAALLDHWGQEQPAVVAHDYGGAVALRTHLLHGGLYRSLTLVDVVALAPWGSPFFRLVNANAEVFEQLPPALHEGLVRSYIAGASHRGLGDDDLDRLVEPWTGPEGQPAFYRQIAQAGQRYTDEIEPGYPDIDLPVHIIWGTEDTWIPVDRAHRLHDLIPGSTLRLIDGAGHLIQLDAPAELAVAVRAAITT